MKITIRHTEDCPHVEQAEKNVREALAATSAQASVTRELVTSSEEAERLAFVGSPTLLIDGADPFVEPNRPPALACRLYQTPEGPKGAPTVAQLREALEQNS